MKKVIIPAAILCTVLCIGLGNQPGEQAEPTLTPTSTPSQVEVSEAPMPELKILEAENEESIVEVITPTPEPMPMQTPESTPTPEPTQIPTPAPVTAPAMAESVYAGDMVYVEGFGWLESQGEGTVIYDEMMYENGNKVGIMD